MIALVRPGNSRPILVHDEEQARVWEGYGYSRQAEPEQPKAGPKRRRTAAARTKKK